MKWQKKLKVGLCGNKFENIFTLVPIRMAKGLMDLTVFFVLQTHFEHISKISEVFIKHRNVSIPFINSHIS